MAKEGMDPQAMLGVLMSLTEDQQKAIAGLLGEFKGEVAGLREAVQAARQGAAKVIGAAQAVDSVIKGATPALRQAAGDGAGAAVDRSLKGAAETAAQALEQASGPVIERLSGVVQAAGQVEGQLRRTAARFSWQWAVLATASTAGGLLIVGLAGSALSGWQRHEIGRLVEQRQALTAEVAQLQGSADEWAKKGGRAKLERCGEQQRLCVRVDSQKAYGKEGDIRYVLRGY